MELEFKPDFAETRERWARFWRGEAERPLVHAIEPKPGVTPAKMPRPYECAFGDLDEFVERTLAWASTHNFLGDTVPSYMITFAPDHFAALLGAEIVRPEHGGSNWVEPFLTTLEDCNIRFQPEGRWWKRTVEAIEKFRAKCDGKLIITPTHLQGGLDGLAAIYGTQETLMDIAMQPELVLRALRQIDAAIVEVREAFDAVLDVKMWGSLNRFHMYSPGRIDVPQSDISCMISSEMFDEFVRPSLEVEVGSVDSCIYHLDGIDAVRHLEALCGLEKLDMIQWMPGEGHYDDDHHELNERIDALGKGQIFQSYYKFDADDVKRIWESYTSRKLFFHVTPEMLREPALAGYMQ